MPTCAVIPGTYDPVTLGHIDIISRTAQIFDRVVVGVAASPKKGSGPLFSLEQRVAFLEEAIAHLGNVTVQPFRDLLVDFAVDQGAKTLVKGLRAVTDFDSEFQQASINYHLNPDLETLFFMSKPEHMFLSSSMVKEIASLGGNIESWVTPTVARALRAVYASS
ncbi:MAG: pantetheine-phosphate adenylyltransferase [Actinomycetia bacterium]|nr:pantetheine-phosphate adenylyltransferase [Actinomycetes bacterium]